MWMFETQEIFLNIAWGKQEYVIFSGIFKELAVYTQYVSILISINYSKRVQG